MAGTGARDLARWAACALLLGLLVAPAASAGEIRYAGQTSQGRKVVMDTDPRGVIKFWQGNLRARCSDGGAARGAQGFLRPFDRANASRFRDQGRYRVRYRNGTVGRFRAEIAGRIGSRGIWRGTVSVRAKYFEDGDKYATCRTGSLGWQASRRSG